MKKIFVICFLLLLIMGIGSVWAQDRKLPEPGGGTVAVLDKVTFVEVRDRGPGIPQRHPLRGREGKNPDC